MKDHVKIKDVSSYYERLKQYSTRGCSLRIRSRTYSYSKRYLFRQDGVTLIELIITIVVLGIALSALVSALSTGIANSSLPLLESKALELGQAYLDEIQAMRFDENSDIGGGQLAAAAIACNAANFSDGETRALYDDVDDYHNLNDAPPILIDSTINMSKYAGYGVTAQVVCAGTELGLANNNLAKRITLTITLPNNSSRSIAFYRGNF
jgi:MSHA pilin protein MshD